MKRMNRPHRKEKRRKEAEERQKVYDSTVDKIALINSRPGESRKERDRILHNIPVITGDSDTDELLEIERCNQEGV